MSIKGFIVNGSTVKYDYDALDNKPVIPSGGGGEITDDLKEALLQLAEKIAYVDANGTTYYNDLYEALYGTAPTTYTVTNNLTHVTNSNSAISVSQGGSYTGTLSCASDYQITTVTITMGGNDVTGTAYSNGTISIANVTGNIVITAVATQRQASLSSISAVFVQGSAVIYTTDALSTLKQYLTVTAYWSDSSSSAVADADYTLSGTLTEGTSTITASYGGKSDTFNVTVSVYDTSPSIGVEGSSLKTDGSTRSNAGACYTAAYAYELDIDAFKQTNYYDSTNNYNNTNGALWKITYNVPNSNSVSFSGYTATVFYNSSDGVIAGASMTFDGTSRTIQDARYNSGYFTLADNIVHIRFTLPLADIEDSYAYWIAPVSGVLPVGVSDGDIIFAGENTQYYGMHNISEASP